MEAKSPRKGRQRKHPTHGQVLEARANNVHIANPWNQGKVLPLRKEVRIIGPWERETFLKSIGEAHTNNFAADQAGVLMANFYHLRNIDPTFGQEWNDAKERANDLIEEMLFDHALGRNGHKVSMAAVIFALKGRRPEIYLAPTVIHETGIDMVHVSMVRDMESQAAPLPKFTIESIASPDDKDKEKD